jgi:hypothetical protein
MTPATGTVASTKLRLGAPLLAGVARGGFVGHAGGRMLISRMSVSLTATGPASR